MAEQHTRLTHGALLKIFSPSCCATQPSTPIILPASEVPRNSPNRENTFCAAFSRMLQVLYRITEASAGVCTCLYPRETSTPATFSESWSFIWQPKVSRKKVPASHPVLRTEREIGCVSGCTSRVGGVPASV